MIRRVQLRGWKAFESLDFVPGPGLTFVTARNGVGKSSLIQGIAWALFGDRSGVEAASMCRTGHTNTTVTVELDSATGELLRIDRAVGGDATATIGGRPVEDIDDAMRTIVGANLDFASRALTISHQSLLDHAARFTELEAHLAEVFGIQALRDAAAAMATKATEIKSANAKIRTASKTAGPNVTSLRQRAVELNDDLAALRSQRDAMVNEVSSAQAAQAAFAERNAAMRAAEDFATKSAEIQARSVELLIKPSADVATEVGATISQLEASISSLTMQAGAETVQIEIANQAIASLNSPGALCPTCQRPLTDDERSAARATHETAILGHTSSLENSQVTISESRVRLHALQSLLHDIQRLGPEPQIPPDDPDVFSPDAAEAVLSRASDLDTTIASSAGALAEIERSIAAAITNAAEDTERYRAIRLEASAQLTADVMTKTVSLIMSERVQPIRDEISARWKQVFGDRGALELSSSGVISMVRDGHEIAFSAFSPGEQIVAMLAVRFLTVAASTTSPFMLLDEPLESLDPPNRRLIASVLAGADRPVEQMIVTTYEEPLVRRIRATVPNVDVQVIG